MKRRRFTTNLILGSLALAVSAGCAVIPSIEILGEKEFLAAVATGPVRGKVFYFQRDVTLEGKVDIAHCQFRFLSRNARMLHGRSAHGNILDCLYDYRTTS